MIMMHRYGAALLLVGLVGASALAPRGLRAQEADAEASASANAEARAEAAASQAQVPRFVLSQREGRFFWTLEHGDRVVLRTPGHATRRAADEGLKKLRRYARRPDHRRVRALEDGRYYFVVEGRRGEILALSPTFEERASARKAGAALSRWVEQARDDGADKADAEADEEG